MGEPPVIPAAARAGRAFVPPVLTRAGDRVRVCYDAAPAGGAFLSRRVRRVKAVEPHYLRLCPVKHQPLYTRSWVRVPRP